MVEAVRATEAECDELLRLMQEHLGDQIGRIMELTGLTLAQFEELYRTRGEVRSIRQGRAVVGYYWIEHRGRELHLHAIFVLPEHQGRGIGTEALRALEREFTGEVDSIELGVMMGNERARALYERLGFVAEETLADVGFLILRRCLGDGAGN